MTEQTTFLLRHRAVPNIDQLQVYRENGGFEAFRKVVTSMQPADVLERERAAEQRGRPEQKQQMRGAQPVNHRLPFVRRGWRRRA